MRVGRQGHVPSTLPPGKSPPIHCTGGWVGPRPVFTGAEKLAARGF